VQLKLYKLEEWIKALLKLAQDDIQLNDFVKWKYWLWKFSNNISLAEHQNLIMDMETNYNLVKATPLKVGWVKGLFLVVGFLGN